MSERRETSESMSSADHLVSGWREISEKWKERDAVESQLQGQEDKFVADLEEATETGLFTSEEKTTLKDLRAGSETHHAHNAGVDASNQHVVENL